MNRGIYPILSGALAHERRMQVFANNMANITTPGFKQDAQSFQALFPARQIAAPGLTAGLAQQIGSRPAGPTERIFAGPHALKTTFEPGRVRLTGNPLDLALEGRSFFEVKTGQGTRYTRNGMLSLDNQRRLVTNQGHPVMGLKGEITIPAGVLEISPSGEIKVNGNPVASIKLVEFPEAHMPQKSADGLFASDQGTLSKNPQLQAGHIEESNVNSIDEMVNMIEGMRSYESAQKLIQTLDRMAEIAIQDVGRVQ